MIARRAGSSGGVWLRRGSTYARVFRVRAALRAAARRTDGPLERTAFRAAERRSREVRPRAALRAWDDSARDEAADRGSRRSTRAIARFRRGDPRT